MYFLNHWVCSAVAASAVWGLPFHPIYESTHQHSQHLIHFVLDLLWWNATHVSEYVNVHWYF